MRAALTPAYGTPDVLVLRDLPEPELGERDLRIAVEAASVTEGDRRLRSADFPGFTGWIGLMMFGLTAPRVQVQGTTFAGRVVEVGSAVTRYEVGDAVFGACDAGAYAERLTISETAAVARIPDGLTPVEAAALPYGAGTAVHFLDELAAVKPGEQVLILGASGGVGLYAVQVAKHLGATVTAVCSPRHFDRARALGADHVLDYHTTDFARAGARYDAILDIPGASSFDAARAALTPTGRYATLIVSLRVLFQMAWTRLVGGQRLLFSVAMNDAASVERLGSLASSGAVRPVVGPTFPFDRIADAHRATEAKREPGTVVVRVAAAQPELRAVG